MPGIARATEDYMTCSASNIPSAGSPTVFVNNKPVTRIGDPTPGHPGGSPSTMKTGNSNSVYANNILICVVGSENNSHGSGAHSGSNPKIAVGSTDVFIG